MKKILISILTIFGVGLSFCSAELSCNNSLNCKLITGHVENLNNTTNMSYKWLFHVPTSSDLSYFPTNYGIYGNNRFTFSCLYENVVGLNCSDIQMTSSYVYNNGQVSSNYRGLDSNCSISFSQSSSTYPFVFDVSARYTTNYSAGYSFDWSCTIVIGDSNYVFPSESGSSCPESETQSIDVYYNNSNSSTSVECDGTQAIEIKGLSSITSTNTRTPYFNINYRDEDNQLLTESYSKDILYLSGGLYKKTYTGNNNRILNVLNVKQDSSFSGYLPVFDITFTGDSLTDTGNIFNNFAQNSLKMTLSNIPSYIQYVIIFGIFLFILGFIRKFKRR